MCNIYKFNLFNPDIALFAVQKIEEVYEKRKLL
jgi:hypothetical protein